MRKSKGRVEEISEIRMLEYKPFTTTYSRQVRYPNKKGASLTNHSSNI